MYRTLGQAQINKIRFQKEHRSHSVGGTGHLSCNVSLFLLSQSSKPLHLSSQLSSLTKLKNLKPWILQLKSWMLHLKSSILNSQTSNLKISNPKALGVGGMSRRLGIYSIWKEAADRTHARCPKKSVPEEVEICRTSLPLFQLTLSWIILQRTRRQDKRIAKKRVSQERRKQGRKGTRRARSLLTQLHLPIACPRRKIC